jgi:anti-anti-sigma regulatory factor
VARKAENHSSDPIGIATRTLSSGRRLLVVSGELDLVSAGALSQALERELASGTRVLLDLSGLGSRRS